MSLAAQSRHAADDFFCGSLVERDPDIARAIELELGGQRHEVELIVETLDGLAENGETGNGTIEAEVKRRVRESTGRFPIYGFSARWSRRVSGRMTIDSDIERAASRAMQENG